MDDAPLVGVHGGQGNATLLAGTLCSRKSNGLKLLLATGLVALDVHHDGVVELDAAAHQGGQHHLKGIQGTAVTTDENREVTTVDVKNELTLVTVVLVDGRLSLAKEGQNLLQIVNGEVGDLVGLLVSKGNAGLKVLANLCKLVVLGSIEDSLYQSLLLVLGDALLHTNLL